MPQPSPPPVALSSTLRTGWRYVWLLAAVSSLGCQSIGLPEQWGAANFAAKQSSTNPHESPSTETVAKPVAAGEDVNSPELVARLRPLLAEGSWSLDPAWSLLEATTDPTTFGPAFAPGYRWRFLPSTPLSAPEAPRLVDGDRPTLPVQPTTEWDWLFRGGNPPTTEDSAASQVVPALQHLAKDSSPTAINASILLWRRFPGQAAERNDVRELLTATPPSSAKPDSEATRLPRRQAALAEAWSTWLAGRSGDPETNLAPAGHLLERPDLSEEVREGLWRGIALRIAPSQIPGLPESLETQAAGSYSHLRQFALEACLVHAVRHTGLKPAWPEQLWLARFDPDSRVRQAFGRWVAVANQPDAVAILSSQRLDADDSVREAAIASLGLVRSEAARQELHRTARKENEILRAQTMRALATWHFRDLEPYLRDSSPRVRAAAVHELYRYPQLPAVTALRDALEDRQPDVQLAALNCLRRLPDPLATPLLLHSLRASLLTVRREAVPQLRSRLGFEPVFPIDGTQEERDQALAELVRARGLSTELWSALPSLAGSMEMPASPDANGEIHSLVEEYLAFESPEDVPPDLADRLSRCDAACTPIFEQVLAGRSGRTADALVTTILPRIDPGYGALRDLQSPDVNTRRAAVRQLQLAGEKGTLSEVVLVRLKDRLLTEQDRYVWQAAVQAVLPDSREPAGQIALLALHHAWPDIRQLGLQYVSRRPQPTYGLWLLPLLKDPQPEVLLETVRLAGLCQNPMLLDGLPAAGDSPATPGLRSLIATPNSELQDAVIVSLCQLGDQTGCQELIRRCHAAEPARRQAAVQAMVRSGRGQFLEPLIQLAWTESSPPVRREMLAALHALAPADDRPENLRPLQSDDSRSESAVAEEQLRAWAEWWEQRRGGAKTSAVR